MVPILSPAQTSTQTTPASKEGVAVRKSLSSRALAFEVAYPSNLGTQPIAARVYVLLERGNSRLEPRFGPDWFRPQPFFARDVKDWKPGADSTDRLHDERLSRPARFARAGRIRGSGSRTAQPRHPQHRHRRGQRLRTGRPRQDRTEGDRARSASKIDKLVPPRKFQETERIKLAELESPLLSAFYHRPIKHRAAVILPEERPVGKLPTVYIIPGFGGDHHMAGMFVANSRMNYAKDMIRVMLDPDCGTGHHVFADSATNGPRGKALIEEFIPYLEKTFPLVADPRARLLNGHSSGGWSSLWLQVTYPDFFGGTWSTSPDPVDFRDFQRINIYAPGENMFRDRQGQSRPIARMGILPIIFYDRFSKMEEVMGPGGQLGSFEAVFSPVGPDGQPRKLWDRATGAIDPEVAKAWEAYDIRLVLERNWPTLGPKLARQDPRHHRRHGHFLSRGSRRASEGLTGPLKSDAVVEIIPGRDHGTVLDVELARRLDREMKAAVAAFVDQNRKDDRSGGKQFSASPGHREVVVNNPDRSTSGRETRRIAGVIFDMDGVLVESEPFIAEAAVRMFAEKGVAVRPEDFRPFIGMGEDRFLGGVAEARDVVLDLPRDKVRTYEIYLELIRGRLEPLPGVADFIGRCRSLGLRLAVASSADRVKVEGNLRRARTPIRNLRRGGGR